MLDLRKLFVREARSRKDGPPPDPDSDYHPSDRPGEGLEVEYQSLIATQFRRWGISPSCITIEVRRLGKAPDGFDVLVGMIRLNRWERDSALRVLVGLPLLEARVRKHVRASWLADYGHFGGLWLHASEHLLKGGATGELRELLMELTPPSVRGGTASGGESSDYATSTVPPSQAPSSPAAGAARTSGRQSVPG